MKKKLFYLLLLTLPLTLCLTACGGDDDNDAVMEIAYNQNLIGNWTHEYNKNFVTYTFKTDKSGVITYRDKNTGKVDTENITWDYSRSYATGDWQLKITFLYETGSATYEFTVGDGYIADPDNVKFFKE